MTGCFWERCGRCLQGELRAEAFDREWINYEEKDKAHIFISSGLSAPRLRSREKCEETDPCR